MPVSAVRLSASAVRTAGHSMHNPLPHVAAKMQQQVGNGIFMRGIAMPNLLIIQMAQARVNISRHLGKFAHGEIEKKFSGFGIHGIGVHGLSVPAAGNGIISICAWPD